MRYQKHWLAGVAVALICAATLACAGDEPEASDDPVLNRRADPATFTAGELNEEAVALLTEFTEYPLFWLGEAFHGFQLTGAQMTGNSVMVTYGECNPSDKELQSAEGASCALPIAIIIEAPGAVPGPDGVPDQSAVLSQERGLVAWDNSSGTMLWVDGSVAISVFSNPDDRAEAIEALRTSNHDVLRIDPVPAGAAISLD